ncbi:MAG: DUF5655 domain-containing protein [Aestuariibacter sp.]
MATPEQQLQTMLTNLPDKTGKPLTEWMTILGDTQHDKHGQVVTYLKSEWQVTHGFANLIAQQFLQKNLNSDDDLVATQYSNGKEALQPIYEQLIKHLAGFGKDVEIAPKKAYVSIRRKKQFAIIQPSTKSRLDVGINLKDTAPTDRLENSGSFNAMVTHRVRLTDMTQVDEELVQYLKNAYQQAG